MVSELYGVQDKFTQTYMKENDGVYINTQLKDI